MDKRLRRRPPPPNEFQTVGEDEDESEAGAGWEQVPGYISLSPWVWVALIVMVLFVLAAFGFAVASFVVSVQTRARIFAALDQADL